MLWVSGYIGFDRIDLKNNKTIHLEPKTIVYCIYPDPENKDILWLGNEGQGVSKLNTKTLKFTHYNQKLPFCKKPLDRIGIYSIATDATGNFILGTENGIIIIDAKTGNSRLYKNIPDDSTTIVEGHIKSIFIDSDNNIWLGSQNNGLSRLDIKNNSSTNYQYDILDNSSLSSDNITCIFEDSRNRFWIGTKQGLNLMNRKTGIFRRIYESDGLPNSTVYSIMEDNNEDLWLSTNKGLCKFHPEEFKFHSYNKKDGLCGNEFNESAFFKNKYGIMYFGGVDGIVYFNPENISENRQIPEVVITDFYINHKNIKLDSSISYLKKLILQPEDDIISFEFSALSYINSSKCRYAYRLKNFKDEWIEIGSNREISFTDLNPGIYTLQIKASNDDGLWCEKPTSLIIEVLPMYYETLGFKVILLVLLFLILLLIIIGRGKFLKRQKRKLELLVVQKTKELEKSNKILSTEIEERVKTTEELRKSNLTKDKFISILAHDLISPFNSLIGFSEILVESWFSYTETERYDIIKQINTTSHNTYNLLSNLLEWSIMQKNEMDFYPKKIDFNKIVTKTIDQIEGQTSLKKITVENEINKQTFVYGDYHMINAILRNLISNAIKFTPVNGIVNITSIIINGVFHCSIKDTGIGMSESTLKSLFSPENTTKSRGTEGETGTGLGLILCKEFISKHNGKIWAESTVDVGSTFHFTLPLNES